MTVVITAPARGGHHVKNEHPRKLSKADRQAERRAEARREKEAAKARKAARILEQAKQTHP